MWVWAIVAVLSAAVGILAVGYAGLSGSVRAIAEEFNDIIADDTNTLISLPSANKAVEHLVCSLNRELAGLRDERRRLQNGDAELKKAVTNITHDIRTPLTAISGYLDLLENEEKSRDAGEYLGVIRERTEALKALTEELFRYSVISSTADELTLEEVDLCAVMEQSIAAYYGALCERGIVPRIRLPEAPVLRRLDRRALSRVFENILNNALKYSQGDLSVSISENGAIELANTAEGLDDVSVGKLFDRFYTVETGRTATGLGLSIAKLLTERMGGSISAELRAHLLTIRILF